MSEVSSPHADSVALPTPVYTTPRLVETGSDKAAGVSPASPSSSEAVSRGPKRNADTCLSPVVERLRFLRRRRQCKPYHVENVLLGLGEPSQGVSECSAAVTIADDDVAPRTDAQQVLASPSSASPSSLFNGGAEMDEQRRIVLNAAGYYGGDADRRIRERKLPGPLPATLGRAQLSARLHQHVYWVCEKSDGERAMLLATRDGVWLVDRKFQFRNMSNTNWTVLSAQCTNGAMLLDGELVNGLESKTTGAPPAGERYMVFDVVCINGDVTVAHLKHSTRRETFEKLLQSWVATTPLSPALFVKQFVNTTDLGSCIFSKITRDSLGHWIYNGDRRGMNRNDGIVFTPEHATYLCKDIDTKTHDIPLLKWKWPGMNTIDFKVRRPFFSIKHPGNDRIWGGGGLSCDVWCVIIEQVELYAGIGHGNDIMVRSAIMSEVDRNDLVRRSTAANLDSVIVECAYDIKIGQWTIKGYRMDKTDANFITTVMATMENIAENVSREELIAAFCGKPPSPSHHPDHYLISSSFKHS